MAEQKTQSEEKNINNKRNQQRTKKGKRKETK